MLLPDVYQNGSGGAVSNELTLGSHSTADLTEQKALRLGHSQSTPILSDKHGGACREKRKHRVHNLGHGARGSPKRGSPKRWTPMRGSPQRSRKQSHPGCVFSEYNVSPDSAWAPFFRNSFALACKANEWDSAPLAPNLETEGKIDRNWQKNLLEEFDDLDQDAEDSMQLGWDDHRQLDNNHGEQTHAFWEMRNNGHSLPQAMSAPPAPWASTSPLCGSANNIVGTTGSGNWKCREIGNAENAGKLDVKGPVKRGQHHNRNLHRSPNQKLPPATKSSVWQTPKFKGASGSKDSKPSEGEHTHDPAWANWLQTRPALGLLKKRQHSVPALLPKTPPRKGATPSQQGTWSSKSDRLPSRKGRDACAGLQEDPGHISAVKSSSHALAESLAGLWGASFSPPATPDENKRQAESKNADERDALSLSNNPHYLHQVAMELNCPIDEIKDARGLFNRYACQGIEEEEGFIYRNQFDDLLMELLEAQGNKLSDADKHAKQHSSWKEADRCKNGRIDFKEFAIWYSSWGFEQHLLLNPGQIAARKMAKEHGLSVAEVDRVCSNFHKFDTDGSGVIDFNEFHILLDKLLKIPSHLELPASRVKQFWLEIDMNGSGVVEFEEFLIWYNKYFDLKTNAATVNPIQQIYESIRPKSRAASRGKHD